MRDMSEIKERMSKLQDLLFRTGRDGGDLKMSIREWYAYQDDLRSRMRELEWVLNEDREYFARGMDAQDGD